MSTTICVCDHAPHWGTCVEGRSAARPHGCGCTIIAPVHPWQGPWQYTAGWKPTTPLPNEDASLAAIREIREELERQRLGWERIERSLKSIAAVCETKDGAA